MGLDRVGHGARIGRRAFVVGTGAVFGSLAIGSETGLAQSIPDPDMGIYPVVPDVDEAWTIMFANADGQTQFSAPVSLRFWAFAFADEKVAAANLGAIATFYEEYLEEASGKSVKHLGIGRFGDERKAYESNVDGQKLAAIIRVGAVIQVSLALAFGGTLTEEMTALLEEILPASDKDPLAFIPALGALPDGWVALSAEPVEITGNVQG